MIGYKIKLNFIKWHWKNSELNSRFDYLLRGERRFVGIITLSIKENSI